ncbi:DNA-binding transcriptional regulator, LysR family [Kosakonia radicincitans]|uniref:DNA-binding transcriptional regulator, LysR family n=2 Tax=Kosakonia radicincitans TaxID=283686 RepID=A0AAX2ENN9_9ENTR|nr:DNA-binding transcriptional regulator, LysR family [Kosakonia radicincitans]SFR02741.1 DNA-binding transcriptional regulator, LysR family [Kosakonia radicincitans]SFT60215.1 DNA-binding transcriptional regulator, LysR family [Kosakonia radicincitans]SFX29428.1 DNA-binding transcriptional regulator, LysR family [Kosakonia radicincitans]SKC22188.1 transcriptional regulator, LysR family [Kosakonia radicincitans]
MHFCMTINIPWEWYRTFLAVMKEGSLSGAARMLAITQPTAGRHIAALESALGLVLFTRSQTGLQPTDAAAALQGHAQAMENTASMIARTAASFSTHTAGLHGVVRVSASEIIGTEVLPSLIARIKEDYPQLTIELVLSNRMQDLLNREVDIAVRMTTPVQEQLIARRLGRIEIGLHASHSYLARHGEPESIDELFSHPLVGFDKMTPFILQALKHYPQLNREAFTLRTDSDVAQLNLIRAGAGIGMCQVQLADFPVPLKRLMPDFFAFRLDTWLVMHEDLRHSQACKTVFDILAGGLQAYINKAGL